MQILYIFAILDLNHLSRICEKCSPCYIYTIAAGFPDRYRGEDGGQLAVNCLGNFHHKCLSKIQTDRRSLYNLIKIKR